MMGSMGCGIDKRDPNRLTVEMKDHVLPRFSPFPPLGFPFFFVSGVHVLGMVNKVESHFHTES